MRRAPEYRVRHHAEHGWYVVASDGHLAHVPTDDGGMRAAFFDTEEAAWEAADDMVGQMT